MRSGWPPWWRGRPLVPKPFTPARACCFFWPAWRRFPRPGSCSAVSAETAMPDVRVSVPVLLGVQALLVSWSAGREAAPPPPDLSRFPSEVRQWKQYRSAPVEVAIQAQLGADSLLSRGYFDGESGSEADLFVAWFRSQLGG